MSEESLAKWLLTGMGGVLGWGIRQALPARTFAFAGRHRPDFWPDAPGVRLDLAVPGEFRGVLEMLQPEVVVHAACISRAQECADFPELTRQVNVAAVQEWLATSTSQESFPLYISTEQVFDGRADSYAESSPVCPLSLYGETKAEAEALVLAEGGAVVRLPLLLGPEVGVGRCGADTAIVKAVGAGQRLRLFHDEYRTPVAAAALGPMLWQIASRRLPGVFHLSGSESVSRLELGEAACELAGLKPNFDAVSAADFAGPPRSLKLNLENTRSQEVLGWEPPNLRQSLAWTATPPAVEVTPVQTEES